MDSGMQDIYPKELGLTSDDAVTSTHYLDLDLEIVDEKINYNLYDKRDAFGFKIVNFQICLGTFQQNKAMEFLLHSWSDMHVVVNIFDILLNVQSF